MHSRENVQSAALEQRRGATSNIKDKRLLVVNGAPQLEYDGLHQGELAWVLGRRFKSAVDESQGTTAFGISEFTEMERYAHQAFAGLGSGVDRMQRLASTGWVESLFTERLGKASIKLHKIRLDSAYAKAMDSNSLQFEKYLAGASILNCPDIAWWRANLEDKPKALAAVGYTGNFGINEGRRAQGINLVDTSPFLRGTQVDSKIVRFDEHEVVGSTTPEDMARNQGDAVSISVFETELRRRNIMDWTPDGIVLSKLESPTDEPMKSTEIDARQAQLFNIGIQGPSITKSWTSDVKNFRLEVQPMDKVFVVVVATLSYRVNSDGNDKFKALRIAQQAVLKALLKHNQAVKDGEQSTIDASKTVLEKAQTDAASAGTEFADTIEAGDEPAYELAVKDINTAQRNLDSAVQAKASPKDIANLKAAIEDANAKLDTLWAMPTNSDVTIIRARSTALRTNLKAVSKANLTNFRLMRTTSSHMSNYSYYKPGDEQSRLKLKMGPIVGGDGNFTQVRDVIVGGWCIGTVIDSAASRSTIGFQTVKSHPTSMAININVNVQWWSGDKLYKHYHDAGGLVMMRGMKRDIDSAGKKLSNPEEDVDAVPAASDQGSLDEPRIAVSGEPDTGHFIPPMDSTRRVRSRTEPAAASGPESAAASAFHVPKSDASSAAKARPGGSRRA